MRGLVRVGIALLALAPAAARAEDDADLIPQGVLDAQGPPTPAPGRAQAPLPSPVWHSKIFAEEAFSLWSPAGRVPVPYPPSLSVAWQNRTSLDASIQLRPKSWLVLNLSDRLNVFEQPQQAFVSSNTLRNDLREASMTWEPAGDYYLEAGRINVRNGAALGFNPTDFFKARSLVGQASLDPSVIRQNRLGALLVRAQALWAWGSSSVVYAPKVSEPSPVNDDHPVGVDPRFTATNAAHRVLCTLSLELLDLSPQLLGYFELHRSKVGVNVTHAIGSAVVAYAEWAVGPEQTLSARAAAFGRRTGTLPPSTPDLLATEAGVALRNDVAAGFSWTVATAVTFNVEYHFHQAGFTRRDWQRWFELGSAAHAPAALTNALWFVRGFASDQQEPISMHQMFVRAAWPRAFTPDLELGAFAFINLFDGSALSQLSASYYVSDAWTASAYVSANIGAERSEHGSFPQRGSLILQATRYF